jgi:hypothetical protein
MIYCPKCGTANRDRSRFCNECGQKLSRSTGIKCPQCGHQNSVQSIFCQECGHRLEAGMPPSEPTPDGPSIKGLSLPVKGQEAVADAPSDEATPSPADDVPAWLQELSAALPPGASVGAEGAGEIPTWLAELGVGLPEADDISESAAPEPARTDDAGEPGTPEPSEADSAGEPAAPQPADMPPVPREPAPLEQSSIWPDEPVQEPEPAPAPEVADEDVPAWLQQLLQKHAAPIVAPDGEADWLGESLPKEAMPSESFWPADIPDAEPEPATETVPTWLAELHGEPDVPSATSLAQPEPTEEAAPIWLHEVEPEDEPFAAAMVTLAAQEAELEPIEPVLRDEAGEPEAEAVPPVPPSAPGAVLETESELVEAELLGWVADLEPEEVPRVLPAAPEAEPELAEDEAPDWVRDLRRGEMAPAPSAALPVAAEAEPELSRREDLTAARLETPSLEGAPAEPPEETTQEVIEGPPELPEDVTPPRDMPERVPGLAREQPAWVGDAENEDDLELEDHWLMQATPEPPDEIPAWMAALRPEAEAASKLEEPVEESMPDWLLTWTEDLLTEGEEELVRADIPEWLWELRPQRALEALDAHPMRGEDRIESHGILAGRKGVLPVEPIMALPPSIDRRPASAPPQDPSRAELFHQVVTQPPLLRPQVVTRPAIETVPAVGRWLIYLFLLVAVVIPLVWETQFFARPAVAPGPVQALYDVVATLEPNAPVLVVFDYTPTSSSEMDLIAETMLDHLIDQQARIVALSLSPTGPQLAQVVLDRVVADRPGYTYCQHYVNLGYVPGQVVAPRALAQTLWEGIPYDHQRRCTGVQGQLLAATDLAVTAGVDTISDFALIVDLAAQQASVRWWIEQVGSQVEGVRLAAAVSAAVEPFIRPYAEATPPQLVGYVAGWPETSDYLGLRGHPEWELEGRLDAQILGLGVIVVVILAGNVAHILRQAKRRE